MYGSDGSDFRRRFKILRDIMIDTQTQVVALQLAFDSLADFIDEHDGIRANYMEEMVMSYCCLSSEFSE